jgi:glycosyltransferase involved in cell wall biosynthesis
MSADRCVVQVVPYYPPHLGGMENVARSLAHALVGRADVRVLTTDRGAGGAPRDEASGGVRVHRSRAVELAHTPIAPGLLWHLLRLPRSAVVHLHVAQALVPEIVWLAGALRRRPYVAHFHLDVDASGRLGRLFTVYKRRVLGAVLRRAAHVIVLSAEQAEFVAATYRVPRARLTILPNGVGAEFFAADRARPTADGATRLLFVGRLSTQKNVPRLLHAVAAVRRPVELVLVGDGEDRALVEATIARLGLTNVRLAGAARGGELVDWYRWADVFVLPSDKEGMPLVLLEAMAAGLPVVATDVPGIRDLVGADGLLTGCDPAELGAGIDRVAGDAHLRARLVAASRRRGAGRSWPSLVPDIEAVYEAVR